MWNALLQDLLAFKICAEEAAATIMGLSLYVTCFVGEGVQVSLIVAAFSKLYFFSILSILTMLCHWYFLSSCCLFCCSVCFLHFYGISFLGLLKLSSMISENS